MRAAVRFPLLSALVGIAAFLVGGCAKPTPIQPLIDAAYNGDVVKCEQLIKSGIPIDSTDEEGDTALDWAIYGHQIDVVRKLIEMGADVNHADRPSGYQSGYTPLMYTAKALRGRKLQDPETMAVRNEIARLLIQHGADVNRATKLGSEDKGGETALHFAVKNQNPQLIRILLAAGADKNAKNDQGYTPLDYAKFPDFANTEVINVLEGK